MADALGIACAYPLRPNGRGGLELVRGADVVANHLRAIVDSAIGDHPFEPQFAWPLEVFMTIQDTEVVQEEIRDAILNWEYAIIESELSVQAAMTDEGVLSVAVFYHIKGEATARTLNAGFRIIQ